MNDPVFPYLYKHLVLSYLILAILIVLSWYLIVVLTALPQWLVFVEHPFMCSFAIFISSSVKCLLSSHFLVGLLLFLNVKFWEILWILGTSSLSDVVCKIFSQSMACLFLIFTCTFTGQLFYFWWAQFINFFLFWIVCFVWSLRTLPRLRSWRFCFWFLFSRSFAVYVKFMILLNFCVWC